MFGTLIESNAHPTRRRGGALASLLAHLVMVGGAVAATTREGGHTPAPIVPDPIIHIQPPHSVCDCAVPPRPAGPALPALPALPHSPPIDVPRITVPVPDAGWLRFPGLDTLAASTTRELTGGGPSLGGGVLGAGTVGGPAGVYTTATVERNVAIVDAPRPVYPAALRAAGVGGRVVLRFVVDTAGRAEPATIEVVQSAHPLLERAARDVLPRWRFAPGEVAGHKVRTLVEVPFEFELRTPF